MYLQWTLKVEKVLTIWFGGYLIFLLLRLVYSGNDDIIQLADTGCPIILVRSHLSYYSGSGNNYGKHCIK